LLFDFNQRNQKNAGAQRPPFEIVKETDLAGLDLIKEIKPCPIDRA
jgi:hypothetical protein